MRIGRRRSSLGESQISDDEECQGGGICPSCRLAVNKDTGRLKWCMGGNDIWRTRIRFMLLIPAVILPVAIIIIALSKSTVIGKLSMRSSHAQSLDPSAAPVAVEDHNTASPVTADLPPVSIVPRDRQQRRKRDMSQRGYEESPVAPSQGGEGKREVGTSNGEKIGKSASNALNGEAHEAASNAVMQQELQVNFSRSPRAKTERARGEANRRGQIEGASGRGRGDGNCDEEEEEDEDSDSPAVDDDDDSVDGEEEEEEEEDEEEEDGSKEPERGRKLPRAFDEGRVGQSYSVDEEDSLNFWEGNWNEDYIRKSQAKVMLRYMDRTADPCRDFYQFACGNWQKYNSIPDDKAGFDTFETLRESLDLVLKRLLEETSPVGTDDAVVKAKNLFRSCMNYEILEKRGERPLLELLDELGGWPILRPDWDSESFDWITLAAQLRLYNNDILIAEWVGPDTKNSDEYIIQFDQTTLGLPTKDYYLQPANAIYLMAYKNYLISVASLLGATHRNARVQAEELVQFETHLANITISLNERRNATELYKRMTLERLHTAIPQIDWHRYLSIVLARPVNYSEPVVLFTMKYLQDLVELIARTPPKTVANYLLWRFVQHRVNNLDDRFQEAKQTFYYILLGRKKSPSRWKNCVAQVNANLGMALGSIFTLAMTHEIQRAFRELLNQSNWLDSVTKEVAGEKVQAMNLRIGYPDFILRSRELDHRYKDVEINPDRYFENTLNILRHLTRIEQDRLGKPVNKTQWNAAPAIVNAYYNRNENQIVFPAGILQPPFYHRYFPRCLNYGGIGVVIGHEITHGFDDKGRLFDKYGNLHRWWSKDIIDEFNQRATCLIDQYSRYVVDEVAMPINGVTTQGENIADNGAIKQAFKAYEKWMSENEDANESLPGMEATGRQLFFLNFAQVWCGSMRPEAMRNKLKTAVHSPGRYRVIGTLSNFEDFAKVFNCPLGSPMNPVKKCLVW
ncbi:neprilysin-4-like isoform X2 [Copidosoma floridanum]|uniref:neprilysin-4-like isoform X2 n=1 Tax=Copidosoma floridanum TaxID=29053 RepID=UPI0006C9AD2E|nr:neprilysin-4-like isoform X2 [Copidosoma floridanum]